MASVRRKVSTFVDSRGHIRDVIRTTTLGNQRGWTWNGIGVDPATDPRVADHPEDMNFDHQVISTSVPQTKLQNPQSVDAWYEEWKAKSGREMRG